RDDVVIDDTVIDETGARARKQPLRHHIVEPTDDNADALAPCGCTAAVLLHDCAVSSSSSSAPAPAAEAPFPSRCPSFDRFVSRYNRLCVPGATWSGSRPVIVRP